MKVKAFALVNANHNEEFYKAEMRLDMCDGSSRNVSINFDSAFNFDSVSLERFIGDLDEISVLKFQEILSSDDFKRDVFSYL